MRAVTLLLLAALLLALVPQVEAQHCETKIVVFGRPAPLPAPAPPYTPQAHGLCPLAVGGTPLDGHTLPPQTGQVLVRVNGDFGPSIQRLFATLDGLGFEDQVFTLHRTPTASGFAMYQMSEWVPLPNGTQLGDLRVSVVYPSVTASVTYRSVS